VSQDDWQTILDVVRCKILSVVSNDHVDAYLLSESSLYVYPHKLVLKTCGTTTLLAGIPPILDVASKQCGLNGVWRVFYSRKTFMFPERQTFPHRTWQEEVTYLDEHFKGGSAYVVGRLNGDCWNLYTTAPSNDCLVSHAVAPAVDVESVEDDMTIEILMTQLNVDKAKLFYLSDDQQEGLISGKQAELECGLRAIYPDATMDSYLFSPCGYSMNGIQDDGYVTVHVTPEAHCSFASFESNIPPSKDESIKQLVMKVVDVFQPGKFSVTVFKSINDSHTSMNDLTLRAMDGWKRTDCILYELEGYVLGFTHFEK
jgi:S-adenosylmethionine decarboxylase